MSPTQRGQKGTPGVRRDQTPGPRRLGPLDAGKAGPPPLTKSAIGDRRAAVLRFRTRACCEAYLADDKRRRCWSATTPALRPLLFCIVPMLGAIRHARWAVGRALASALAFGVVGAVVLEGAAPNSSASVGCSTDLKCIHPYSYYLLADARKSKPRCLGVYPYTRGPLERLMMRAVSLRRTTDDAGSCDFRRDSYCYDHPGFRRADHAKLAG